MIRILRHLRLSFKLEGLEIWVKNIVEDLGIGAEKIVEGLRI